MHSQVVITKNQVLIYNKGRGLLFEEIRYTRNVNQKMLSISTDVIYKQAYHHAQMLITS